LDGSDQPTERSVEQIFWEDMRTAESFVVPKPGAELFDVWAIDLRGDEVTKPVSDDYLGMLYEIDDDVVALTFPRSSSDLCIDSFLAEHALDEELALLSSAGGGLAAALAEYSGSKKSFANLKISNDCTRSRRETLSARVSSSYYNSRTAALNAAKANAQVYGDDVARGRGRMERCDGPCFGCSSGSATVTITSTDTDVSLIASTFYGTWKYTATVEFSYTFWVGCCKLGAA
jgi:hypothetical protein